MTHRIFTLCTLFVLVVTSLCGGSLEQIKTRAKESDSDAVLLMKDGYVMWDYYSGNPKEPIELMSMTKSVVSLAIGFLLEEGKLPSLDLPLYNLYPEWKQGYKKEITVRHLLTHTSGIQAGSSIDEIYDAPDAIQLALAAELSNVPGTRFFYNNKAVNLLADVVEKLSGLPLDEYLDVKLFTPLGITSASWLYSDKADHPYAMSHLQMNAQDLSKLGQFILNKGLWEDKRLISPLWLEMSFSPSQEFTPFSGFFWWLDYDAVEAKWDEKGVQKIARLGVPADKTAGLVDKTFDLKGTEWISAIGGNETASKVVGDPAFLDVKVKFAGFNQGKLKSISAKGYLGQYFIIIPDKKIIAIRQIRGDKKPDSQVDTFSDFQDLVYGWAAE